ncbi:hypothetical protein [Kitasatospora sp. GP82]|uniref:hypothetical protein n=1 Tax=Kitasatospora sp. GP82 TaxID=3035089 RepID=UPI00247430A9|nr:hypothetical protein [Kitasatospora sp. GP82]MDH6129236.1 hypothetical protein [Kitasatospora sp. GP82]
MFHALQYPSENSEHGRYYSASDDCGGVVEAAHACTALLHSQTVQGLCQDGFVPANGLVRVEIDSRGIRRL